MIKKINDRCKEAKETIEKYVPDVLEIRNFKRFMEDNFKKDKA